jgi:hypothetical protein
VDEEENAVNMEREKKWMAPKGGTCRTLTRKNLPRAQNEKPGEDSQRA